MQYAKRKFRQSEVESTSKFAKILNEIRTVSFVHFREFPTKISLETLVYIDISNIRGQYECVKIRIVWFLSGL